MRKFIAASLFLLIANAVPAADQFAGHVTHFEDGKMIVNRSKGTEPPVDVTLKVADNVKIVRGQFSRETMKIEAGEAYEGGKEAFAKQVRDTAEKVKKWTEEGKKGFGAGVFASIFTEGDKVIEIRVTGGGRKKQDK